MVKLILEICPPSIVDSFSDFYQRIAHLVTKIEGISIPSKPSKSINDGFPKSFRFAQYLKEKEPDLNIVVHVTCYDLNRDNIHGRLAKLNSIGVNEILVVTGDKYRIPEQNRGIHFLNSSQLVNYILQDSHWQGSVAVAGYPENDLDQECSRLREKMKTGADCIYTQCLFSPIKFRQFVESLTKEKRNIRIIPSVALFKDSLSLRRCYNLIGLEEDVEIIFQLSQVREPFCQVYVVDLLTKLCKQLLAIPAEQVINICTFNHFLIAEQLILNLSKLNP